MFKNKLLSFLSKVCLLVVIISVFTVFTGCSNTKTLKIGVPNDGTNQGRAIKLLESAGLIEVDPNAGYSPELKDITKYLYDIQIVPTKPELLPSLLDDYAACIINGQFAAANGLSPSKDGLLVEKQEEGSSNPYINVIAARTNEKDNEIYKQIVNAYQKQNVAEYLLQRYNETYYPAFSYSEFTNDESFVNEITNYTSSKENKTVVKVGVCGQSNEQWKAVQKNLDDENLNIYIELVIFSTYNLPNEALNSKDIDLNAFQHYAYLESEVKAEGYDIVAIGETLIAPLTLYSKGSNSLEQLKEKLTKI